MVWRRQTKGSPGASAKPPLYSYVYVIDEYAFEWRIYSIFSASILCLDFMKDKQGILRGGCTVCPCTEYIRDSIRENKQRCKNCDHVPTKHNAVGRSDETNDSCDWESEENLEPAGEIDNVTPPNVIHAWDSLGKDSWENNSDFYNCQFPGRNDMANFEQNTRQYNSVYGYNHLSTASVTNRAPADVLSMHPQPHTMLIDSGQLFVNNYIALLTVTYQVTSVATQAVVDYAM